MTASRTRAITTNISAELLTAAQAIRALADSIDPANQSAIETANAIANSLLRNAAACVGLEALIQALPAAGGPATPEGHGAVQHEIEATYDETVAEEETEADEGD